jgi:hypothetical protein
VRRGAFVGHRCSAFCFLKLIDPIRILQYSKMFAFLNQNCLSVLNNTKIVIRIIVLIVVSELRFFGLKVRVFHDWYF